MQLASRQRPLSTERDLDAPCESTTARGRPRRLGSVFNLYPLAPPGEGDGDESLLHEHEP
eukprot:scaffold55515_cov26-Tisochrysis_lutea.AAC.7